MFVRKHMSNPQLVRKSRIDAFKRRSKTFSRAERGAAAVFFALSSPVWIGGLAFGVEVGSWYYYHHKVQGVADMLALGVAGRVATIASQDELELLKTRILFWERFDGVVTRLNVSGGPIYKNPVIVDAAVSMTVQRHFTKIFSSSDSFQMEASAMAEAQQNSPACVLSLERMDSTGIDFGLRVESGTIKLPTCDAVSNHTDDEDGFNVRAGATLNARCARTAGKFLVQGQLAVTCKDGRREKAGYALDPYEDLPEINLTDYPCTRNGSGQSYKWDYLGLGGQFPAAATGPDGQKYLRFCNGANLIIDRTWADLGEVFDGDVLLIFDNTSRFETGSQVSTLKYDKGGIQFYFANNGRPNMTNPTAKIMLRAPSSGPRAGILFFGERDNNATGLISVAGNDPWSGILGGAIYMPGSTVQFRGSGQNWGGCTQIIGARVVLSGTWTGNGPCTIAGTSPVVASQVVRLITPPAN